MKILSRFKKLEHWDGWVTSFFLDLKQSNGQNEVYEVHFELHTRLKVEGREESIASREEVQDHP